MRAYVGQTRSPELIDFLQHHDIGECTCRGELPPRRTPWFYDNGAYRDWRKGLPSDAYRLLDDLAHVRVGLVTLPDFVVAPDLVAQGEESLKESRFWLPHIRAELGRPVPVYLAVQDGMTPDSVVGLLTDFDGLFVGGTTAWKKATAREWVTLAHEHGLPCHVGRCGMPRLIRWAHSIGADSIDSSFPLWHRGRLSQFVRLLDALRNERPPCPQPTLF
jgi:hypothetical protein